QGSLKLPPLARRQAVGESVRRGDVHRDGRGISLFDDAPQQVPLSLPDQLGATADRRVDRLARVIGVVQPALRRAAEREPLERLSGPPIVKNVDRAAPREEGGGRDQ